MKKDVNNFKQKLQKTSVLGCFSKTTDASIIEIIGISDFDFVIIDMEHGPIGLESIKNHFMACELNNLTSIVRVPHYKSELIEKVLDLGADGVQIPSITDEKQVREIINKSKFFPRGNRGVCRFVRAAGYSDINRNEYFAESNDKLIIIQLEGIEGLRNYEKIVEIEEIDIIFIGPYDLSQSLGVPGDIENKIVVDEIVKIVKKATEKGKLIGTFCDTLNQLNFWKSLGVSYLAYSVDYAILLEALRKIHKNSTNDN